METNNTTPPPSANQSKMSNQKPVNAHGSQNVNMADELKKLTYIHQDSSGALRVRIPGRPSKLFLRNRYKNSQDQVNDAVKWRDEQLKNEMDQTNYPKLIMQIKTASRLKRFGSLSEQLNFNRIFAQARVTPAQAYAGLIDMFKRLPTAHPTIMKPGEMYFYAYDAKHKDKLDYWDGLPLIYIINRYPDGFLGLNLHYLSPMQRQAVMMAFLQSANRNRFNQLKRMRLDYDISLSLAGDALIKPMVHRYLYSQLRSPIKVVPHDMWTEAVFLPIAKWHKNV